MWPFEVSRFVAGKSEQSQHLWGAEGLYFAVDYSGLQRRFGLAGLGGGAASDFGPVSGSESGLGLAPKLGIYGY